MKARSKERRMAGRAANTCFLEIRVLECRISIYQIYSVVPL
jgi:hypothetical protein